MDGHFIDRCPIIAEELDMISNMQHILSPEVLTENLWMLSYQLLTRYVRLNYGMSSLANTSGGKRGLIEVIVSRSDGGGYRNDETRLTSGTRLHSAPAILNNDCILLDDLYEHISNEHVRQLFHLIYSRKIPFVEASVLPAIPFDERIPIVKAVESQNNEDIPLATTVVLY
jgi:hypothetical protein